MPKSRFVGWAELFRFKPGRDPVGRQPVVGHDVRKRTIEDKTAFTRGTPRGVFASNGLIAATFRLQDRHLSIRGLNTARRSSSTRTAKLRAVHTQPKPGPVLLTSRLAAHDPLQTSAIRLKMKVA